MSGLSTHVLDTSHGKPAAGVSVRLTRNGMLLYEGRTNGDGRCPSLPSVQSGQYRIEFSVAEYFTGLGLNLPDPPFLDLVAIDFGVAEDAGHYHVPLLVSPFGYSTYRGS